MPPFSVPPPSQPLRGDIPLVASKSESNRALILQALAGPSIVLDNLSAARDTQLLAALLQSDAETLDARDAGTTLRFLTAYCAATNRPTLLTGTQRMCERPIGILVEALKNLGADIVYEGKEGFPPHRILSFTQKTNHVAVRGDVSSQYISALLLIAPSLPLGLELELVGATASRPYIDMTIQWMARFGLLVHESPRGFLIPPQHPRGGRYTIESDWSGAGYWYSLLALCGKGELFLRNLRKDSLQGDRAIALLFENLGVLSHFTNDGLRLRTAPRKDSFQADFTHIPDQAQTFAVCCAGLGIPARLTGLKSLRIKETDRIAALQNELRAFGCEAIVEGDEALRLPGGPLRVQNQIVRTYDDHRMAMAFAPLAALGPLRIDEAGVVAKSYPNFWDDWSRISSEVSLPNDHQPLG